MIVFDLKCLDGGDVFEGWFNSSDDYVDQKGRGLVQCPFCGSSRIEKAPMAPRVNRAVAETGPAQKLAELVALQKALLKDSEWVGPELADRARAMHQGEIERKSVHGEATVDDARSLLEEGVPLLPLPLPVVPPGQVN